MENLRCEIWRDRDHMVWVGFGQLGSQYRSSLLIQWSEHPETLAEHRNFLHVGELDTGAAPTPNPLDRTANAVLRDRIETDNQHWWYKTQADTTD